VPSAISNRPIVAAAALFLLGCGAPPTSVVVVTLDTLRRDHVGCYGSERGLTPNLDALAAKGLVHDAAFTTMPTTGPAHASLFTGLLPSEHGSRQNGDPVSPDAARRSLASALRSRGFATAAFVTTQLLAPSATGLPGFEIVDVPRGHLRPGSEAVAAALAWLDAERRRPVLLWVHLYDPHAPYGGADDKRRGIPLPPGRYGWITDPRLAEPAERSRMEQLYAQGVRAADAALGELLDGVRERLPRALVVVAADHGESLAEHIESRGWGFDHGEYLDDEAIRIPLVLQGPGIAPGRSAGAASLRDLYTTLLGATGDADPLAAAEGRRDLRHPADDRRLVVVERRSFGARGDPRVRAHAAAASDGRELVIAPEDAGPDVLAGAAPDLAELAARHAKAVAGASPPAGVDPQMQDALRSLGYAE
jgi:arylsulfatase A-like enzyme